MAGDEWYYRRREDAEGRFFHAIADQGPRKRDPANPSTRQGIYVFTPGGKLLGYAYGDVQPERFHRVLIDSLAAWESLPEAERRPGAQRIPAMGAPDARFVREPPARGLVLSVHTRALVRSEEGELREATGESCLFEGSVPVRAQPDRLWLTESEWRSLVPAHAKKGARVAFPPPLTTRIARFHLLDDTRGEMPHWRREEVRSADLAAIVESVSETGVQMRVEGSFVLMKAAEQGDYARGFLVRVIGAIHVDTAQDRIDRFEMAAVGDHWGNGPFTASPRPGFQPIGIAFRLLEQGSSFARIPPHGARDLDDYLGLGDARAPEGIGPPLSTRTVRR